MEDDNENLIEDVEELTKKVNDENQQLKEDESKLQMINDSVLLKTSLNKQLKKEKLMLLKKLTETEQVKERLETDVLHKNYMVKKMKKKAQKKRDIMLRSLDSMSEDHDAMSSNTNDSSNFKDSFKMSRSMGSSSKVKTNASLLDFDKEYASVTTHRRSLFDETEISSFGAIQRQWDEIPEESDENSSIDEITPRRLEEEKEEQARLLEELTSSTKNTVKAFEMPNDPKTKPDQNVVNVSTKREQLQISHISILEDSEDDCSHFMSPTTASDHLKNMNQISIPTLDMSKVTNKHSKKGLFISTDNPIN